MPSKKNTRTVDDPLEIAWAPPKDETPEQRERRESEEELARSVSLSIDEEIKVAKQALKKDKKIIKVLLLGQSESGKSTTIKNFQINYAREDWIRERAGWKLIIYLNLVRSVNDILDVLANEFDPPSTASSSHTPPSPSTSTSPRFPPAPQPGTFGLSRHTSLVSSSFSASYQNVGQLKLLALRLGPLRQIQHDLESLIGSGSTEVDARTTATRSKGKQRADVVEDDDDRLEREGGDQGWGWGLMMKTSPISQEFCIVSRSGWKPALNRITSRSPSPSGRPYNGAKGNPAKEDPEPGRKRAGLTRSRRSTDDIEEVIVSCKSDIVALWADAGVRRLLAEHEIHLEDRPGFFLNDVERLATREYEPTDDDIVRARLRTMGVQEYRFRVPSTDLCGPTTWIMYDVAGIRTSRAAWYPYFDSCTALIFLAPISAFNETLAEDPTVNRLEDSLFLWKSVVKSKILEGVQIVLLLNKCDLLAEKLKKGLFVKDSIRDFGTRENEVKVVCKYFREAFKVVLRDATPKRTFYAHLTSVVDTNATRATLASVQDSITRKHFEAAGLY